MIAYRNFFSFLPLSNWVKGFDRYQQSFSKQTIPGAHFPDCFYVLEEGTSKDIVKQVLAKTRRLVDRLGIDGDRVIFIKCRLPVDEVDGQPHATPNTFTGTGIGWRWPSPTVPIIGQGFLDEQDRFIPAHHEGITAEAFLLPDHSLNTWEECVPRSFSVLPIAKACNASCSFCFSKASVSDSVIPSKLDLEGISQWASYSAARGATRAVITGGGEPALLPFNVMKDLISTLAKDFPSILLITNGSRFVSQTEKMGRERVLDELRQWRGAGLSRIAISRHGLDEAGDERLMGLRVPGSEVLSILHEAEMPSRLICVLQKGGVETPADVKKYLERAARENCGQVCFKELYVSSLSENPRAPSKENLYCQANQIPLSMLIGALNGLGFKQVDTLPWGSPVYVGKVDGKTLRVAAYTEPSVGWERTNGIVRSWNWLSDGSCLASLEDPASGIAYTIET